ncbi:MAG: hypothetical protein ACYC61_21215 [Isosphaeraceae bacterium]
MPYDGDPDHPIVERPWEYEIVGLCYHRDPDSSADDSIDLTLQKGPRRVCLRFLGPQELQITEGFPNSSGLCILDVSKRQFDGLRVRVANLEAHGGCPTFWAREVVELDTSDRG